MNIRAKLRAALLNEGAHKANKYGCLMVYLGFDKTEWKNTQDIIKEEDLYEPKGETGFGKEKDPHITILYGFHKEISDADIEVEINKLKKPKLKLGKVSKFENDKFEVLKYDIISDDIHKANKTFSKFPYTSDFPEYHPHCTIAYVKKGTADEYIKKLNEMDPIKVTSDKLVYSKADGEKKDYKFKKED